MVPIYFSEFILMNQRQSFVRVFLWSDFIFVTILKVVLSLFCLYALKCVNFHVDTLNLP